MSSKKGTPLYGQPSWWGENDADEHNKQLLKDIQKRKETEKIHQKTVEEERNQKRSSPERHRSGVESKFKDFDFPLGPSALSINPKNPLCAEVKNIKLYRGCKLPVLPKRVIYFSMSNVWCLQTTCCNY